MIRALLPCVMALTICGFVQTTLAAPQQSKTQTPPKAVIAVFQLSGALTEQPADDTLPFFGMPGPSLRDVVRRMNKAAEDPDVKAVVVTCHGASFGLAQAEELRQAMLKVRAAGKRRS